MSDSLSFICTTAHVLSDTAMTMVNLCCQDIINMSRLEIVPRIGGHDVSLGPDHLGPWTMPRSAAMMARWCLGDYSWTWSPCFGRTKH